MSMTDLERNQERSHFHLPRVKREGGKKGGREEGREGGTDGADDRRSMHYVVFTDTQSEPHGR